MGRDTLRIRRMSLSLNSLHRNPIVYHGPPPNAKQPPVFLALTRHPQDKQPLDAPKSNITPPLPPPELGPIVRLVEIDRKAQGRVPRRLLDQNLVAPLL